jgi:diguanylate cyclase (GGDEF)-like protein
MRKHQTLLTLEATFEEFRFKEFGKVVRNISLTVACLMPPFMVLRDSVLNPERTQTSINLAFLSLGALALYPIALWAGMRRQTLPLVMLLGLLLVVFLDTLAWTQHPGDAVAPLILFIYLFVYAPILALPFGLKVTLPSLALLLVVPVVATAAGAFPGFPLVRCLFCVLPPGLTMIYLELLITRNLKDNYNLRKNLEELAIKDPLTGLHNRRYFMQAGSDHLLLAIRNRAPLSVLLLDLDHFKRVNDTYGHATGDRAIRLAAEVLRRELRTTDVVARIGGEEFVACLPNSGLEAARGAAERIRAALEATTLKVEGADATFGITGSLGVTEANVDSDTLEQLIHKADQALYEAKSGGRNRIACAE